MIEYQTLEKVTGPLLFMDEVTGVKYGEIVEIEIDGKKRAGQVLELAGKRAIIEVFQGTGGVDIEKTKVRFTGKSMTLGVSEDMISNVFNGMGRPMNGKLSIEKKLDIEGLPINPISREYPKEFIETGISSIDLMMSLTRGQKLPIFSGSGLPHTKLAAQIASQARLPSGEDFIIIFAGIGITSDEVRYFRDVFEKTGAMERIVFFVNTSIDPTFERITTPKVAMTTAEYFAWERGYHVFVILTDMTSYCNALREISSAKEEIPGRRGYPPYLYTDLAKLFERSGKIEKKKGSITVMPILTMPEDDITHPIPDLTGYITEGQVLLSRDLFVKGIYPPVDPLSSLSRLMPKGVGKGMTREDHMSLSNQCYANLSEAEKIKSMINIIGEEGLEDRERSYLKWATEFEQKVIRQQVGERRSIDTTLDLAWEALSCMPQDELKRIPEEMLKKYLRSK
jgi:V/A-type H+/Na+-transporting ATPase subunit B